MVNGRLLPYPSLKTVISYENVNFHLHGNDVCLLYLIPIDKLADGGYEDFSVTSQ